MYLVRVKLNKIDLSNGCHASFFSWLDRCNAVVWRLQNSVETVMRTVVGDRLSVRSTDTVYYVDDVAYVVRSLLCHLPALYKIIYCLSDLTSLPVISHCATLRSEQRAIYSARIRYRPYDVKCKHLTCPRKLITGHLSLPHDVKKLKK